MAESASSGASSVSALKRNSGDVGWKYGILIDPNNKDRWKCKLCGYEKGGGVYRLKQHIANINGNVKSCPNSSDEDKQKCRSAIAEASNKKKEKLQNDMNIRAEVNVTPIPEDEVGFEDDDLGSRKRPHFAGPMDKFANPINPNLSASKKMRQQAINDAMWKERTHDVHRHLDRWMYETGIPFHAIDNNIFKDFVEAVGQFGPGYQPASQYQLREPLLKEEVERTKKSLKKQEEECASTGCSIMTDAWSDRKRRSIMNLCVNSRIGTTFISSKEDSMESHTGEYIFNYVEKCIQDFGSEKVVQVVTDNASNNMAAAALLKIKRPHLFWTLCATHTINLMLQGIGRQTKFKKNIDMEKAFTQFIYNHHKTLAMMRKATNERELVRPGVTRFATAFLTLNSMMELKENLRTMFSLNEWANSKHAKQTKGKTAYATVTSNSFWSGVSLCLKVFGPLVRVLRIVDGDKPSMAFVYGELKKAREDIKEVYKQVETNYRPILEVIDHHANNRLDSPLHLTAYLLNPFYFFKDLTIGDDHVIMDGVFDCVDSFFPDDPTLQHEVINVELLKYKNKEGAFGRPLAAKGCENNNDTYDPVGWWSNYGNHTPNLRRMAIRILSLTSSSSVCERNWSTFEGIHTKKRNRLDAERLNNLVYVQFNAKLANKKKMAKVTDVLLASEASDAQGWLVRDVEIDDEVDPISGLTWGLIGEAMGVDEALQNRRSARISERIRELDEEDFESDIDSEGEEDFECESDGDRVVETLGEE